MKLECIKDKIKEAVSLTERVTSKNLTLPVLQTILLIAKNKTLILRSTNLDLGVEIKIPVKIVKDGVVAVPGSILNNFLSNVHDNSIIIDSENDNVVIKTKNSSTTIKSYPYDDFPTIPTLLKEESCTIDSKKFVDGLRSVWYSASFSDSKPEISSVYVYQDNENLVFVATDSFRLAEKRIQFSHKGRISSFLIPFKNVTELIRIFGGSDGDMLISLNKNQISFKADEIYVVSRIIDGVFPDYKQIMPKDFVSNVIVLRQDIINALKLNNLFSDRLNQINIHLNPAKKIFQLNSKNSDVGENTVQIEAALSGNSLDLNFNHKYVFDCFQSITKDSLSLQFSGENKPLVIQGVGDKSFTYLVMPLTQ